ncbi:sensor domain-containing diguanylate cyclase [Oceanidesulfovibrio marinus]|uniref:diguanylate cyclase n=1 Tax=Oceanidesulfovibrio marinus TaxID=370038 RepID=A0A6P1ZFQ7_9BACT|nr:sensor domain-containing diguanylate cyclase [Oceanidesulfovibrio marinus]QJT09420.1 diguanylate cyclase [Oceanidesulfovibrio marinus]TVM33642.1 GGDEF domain-containing protein [Oceanidesulfovibrio marinus]
MRFPFSWLVSHRNAFLIIITLVLLFSFLGISALNYSITRSSIRQEIIQNDLPLTRDNIYSDITSELMRPIMVASSMANDSFLKDWTKEGEKDLSQITNYLRQIRNKFGYFSTFFVSAKTLTYYHYMGVHKYIKPDNAHDQWYYDFIASGKEHDLDVDTDEASDNILTVFLNFRVSDKDGRLLGVTGVGLKIDEIRNLIAEYQHKYHRSIYLVAPNGMVQVHLQKKLIEQLDIHHSDMAAIADDILKTRNEPRNFQFKRDGKNILLTVRYIPELEWLLFVEQDEASAMQIARMNFMRTIVIGVAASIVIILLTIYMINSYQLRVESLALTDELTGASNRRGFEKEFSKSAYALERYNRPCSVILMDLDSFKPVNDELGHKVGDQVLEQVVEKISSNIRPTDMLGRWGGDEFIVLAEGTSQDAVMVAERIRRAIKEMDFAGADAQPDDPRRAVTICCGVAQLIKGENLDHLVQRADKALYAGKTHGGDSVRIHSPIRG